MIPTGLARKLRFSTSDLVLPAMPSSGAAKLLQLKGDRTGLEFIDVPSGGGGGTWGSITGTLSAQTDLQAALDAKASTASVSAKLDAAGGIATGAWELRSGYGSGGLRPWNNSGTNGQNGVKVVNYFGNDIMMLYGDNSGNMGIRNSNGSAALSMDSSGFVSATKFYPSDSNGGAVSSPLFATDRTVSGEGGIYSPRTGATAEVRAMIFCTNRTDRLRIYLGGEIRFVSSVVTMPSLPTADPASAGQLWNNSGVVTVSAG